MDRLLESGADTLVLWMALLATVIAVAVYAISQARAKSAQQEPTTHDLLTKFRELHSRGELSDAEFRTIKTTLASQLKTELKDNDETA
jgi:uncharacterized membrane protein